MSIRLQLLVIALTTLALPWAGCQYARELESTLRLSQENALLAAADTIANALSAQPQRVFRDVGDFGTLDAAAGDLYVFGLHNEPLLDGYREDWDVPAELRPLPASGGLAARALAGFTERYLLLYLEVDDARFEPEPANPHPETDEFDRIDVVLLRPDGTVEPHFFATAAPGPVEAQTVIRGADGVDSTGWEPRIQGYWRSTSLGYTLEARIPRSLVSSRLWLHVHAAGGRDAGVTFADPGSGGRLFSATPRLADLLATFIAPGTRATVVDGGGFILGASGTPVSSADEPARTPGGTWYRGFVAHDTSDWPVYVSRLDRVESNSVSAALAGHRGAEWLRTDPGRAAMLSAAAPLVIDGTIRGAVVLEQSGDQMLDLRERALGNLFNRTLLAAALAVALAFGVATLISLRILRLRLAAETAVANDGTICLDMPGSRRNDEIGDLARGFERLLARLDEHTRYLRTLGAKLSHELRTPLTIVRSSLDNLESEGVRPDQRGYVDRARAGTQRLQSILSALGAASRVEESIKQADRVNFDLSLLLQSAVAGYRDAFPDARIVLEVPPDPCVMQGAPDLIVQMLDKLIENAIDFCSAPGAILVRMDLRDPTVCAIAVANDGPTIPDTGQDRLFQSLYEHRRRGDDQPHFGLGLYIVRLIAEFHGGRAEAANRTDGTGAVFTVVLPLIRAVC